METEKSLNGNSAETPEQSTEALDYQEQVDQKKQDRVLGSKILSQANFETRHQPIVESSFNKARQKGEKLPGKNNERRNYSYLSRIESLVDERGNRLEKRLWNKSIDQLIISSEDIADDYWRTQEQILRDNGQGRTLSNYEKRVLTEDIQKAQRESLKSWSDYLGNEESPYPMWFKVYAWDGMSKMGVFDKEKQQFAKRDKHTVAPYPKLNPAVLAKVYGAISDFYGQSDEDRYAENPERDVELEALVKSGNFNKLYSKILLSEKAIPKTPERTEDVHGEWVEYLPGEEEKLAAAAEGTPWCVADPGTGKNYLEHGSYADYEDYDDYDPADPYRRHSDENQAKFILFHLQDPETNTLSSSACASVRLNTDGRVAEISGLNEGQALEDSLVPIVEEKVRSLPGGEEFLEAFADKKQLITLDRKMQNSEDLTKEELEFLYEFKRSIKTLDTYVDEDPRVEELKEKYGLDYALKQGVDPIQIVAHNPIWSLGHLDNFVSANVDVNNLIPFFGEGQLCSHLDDFMSHGGDIHEIVDYLSPGMTICHLDTLNEKGANIDVHELVIRLTPVQVVYNLDTILAHHVDVDMKDLMSNLSPDLILYGAEKLTAHGAEIDLNELVSKASDDAIISNCDYLELHGVKPDRAKIIFNLLQDPKVKRHECADIWERMRGLGTITVGQPGRNKLRRFVKGVGADDIVRLLDAGIDDKDVYQLFKHLGQIKRTTIDQLISSLEPQAAEQLKKVSRDFRWLTD